MNGLCCDLYKENRNVQTYYNKNYAFSKYVIRFPVYHKGTVVF